MTSKSSSRRQKFVMTTKSSSWCEEEFFFKWNWIFRYKIVAMGNFVCLKSYYISFSSLFSAWTPDDIRRNKMSPYKGTSLWYMFDICRIVWVSGVAATPVAKAVELILWWNNIDYGIICLYLLSVSAPYGHITCRHYWLLNPLVEMICVRQGWGWLYREICVIFINTQYNHSYIAMPLHIWAGLEHSYNVRIPRTYCLTFYIKLTGLSWEMVDSDINMLLSLTNLKFISMYTNVCHIHMTVYGLCKWIR